MRAIAFEPAARAEQPPRIEAADIGHDRVRLVLLNGFLIRETLRAHGWQYAAKSADLPAVRWWEGPRDLARQLCAKLRDSHPEVQITVPVPFTVGRQAPAQQPLPGYTTKRHTGRAGAVDLIEYAAALEGVARALRNLASKEPSP